MRNSSSGAASREWCSAQARGQFPDHLPAAPDQPGALFNQFIVPVLQFIRSRPSFTDHAEQLISLLHYFLVALKPPQIASIPLGNEDVQEPPPVRRGALGTSARSSALKKHCVDGADQPERPVRLTRSTRICLRNENTGAFELPGGDSSAAAGRGALIPDKYLHPVSLPSGRLPPTSP